MSRPVLGALAMFWSVAVIAVALWRHAMWTAGLVGALGVVVCVAVLRERLTFRLRGYRVRRLGREEYVYEERGLGSEVRQWPLWREMLGGSGGAVEVPSQASWDSQVPSWAQGRRAEILGRVAECLGPRNQLVDSRSMRSGSGGAA